MMRLHRLSPDIVPLSNGRKPSLRTNCKEDESDHSSKLSNYSQLDNKSLRTSRSNSSPTGDQQQHFSDADNFAPGTATMRPSESQLALLGSPNKSQNYQTEINGFSNGGSGDLLQWGHNKRSRGSRTDSRNSPSATTGMENLVASVQSRRQLVKIQRRSAAIAAAEKVAAAAAAMPPPCSSSSYSRGANLRPASAGRECRAIEDRSGGLSRSPARKSAKPTSNLEFNMNSESKQTSEPENVGNVTVAATPTAIEKINLDRYELPRIYLTLSRKEKEDDFLAMKGTKLPQRPKKRAKNIDKTLQYCFPGMWLSDLTRSRYEVREKKCVKKIPVSSCFPYHYSATKTIKRRRGLKGMESMDSDSE